MQGIARVGNKGDETVGDAETAFDLGQQHDATVGRHPSAIEDSGDLFGTNGWKFEGRNGIDHDGGCGAVFERAGLA